MGADLATRRLGGGNTALAHAIPIAAGFDLAVNKAQSLTMKGDVVVHLVGSSRFRSASKHGLPFVAFTRSESFGMTASKNLPPWGDF